MRRPPSQDTVHDVHNYARLVARWRRIARAARLPLEEFARAGEYPIYCLRTPGDGGLYVSAGIHGDEPAGSEALATWAETHLATLVRLKQSLPLLLLPCLNPWGLTNNRRSDQRGHDLNRVFHRRITPIRELKKLIAGRQFALALHLHEDYDARGIYVYEINPEPPDWGSDLLRASSSKVLPIDPRRRIDDWKFRNGCFVRRARLDRVPVHPEAIYLFLHHTRHAMTFETPSEFSLTRRVAAHVAMIEACMRRLQRSATKQRANNGSGRQ